MTWGSSWDREKWTTRFRKGDTVLLRKKWQRGPWENYRQGTILYPTFTQGWGLSAGNPSHNWCVRWDGYDYGPSEDNCHHANDAVLELAMPTDSEMIDALNSIQQAARNAMSTRRPCE